MIQRSKNKCVWCKVFWLFKIILKNDYIYLHMYHFTLR
jgi:hypothetical protein